MPRGEEKRRKGEERQGEKKMTNLKTWFVSSHLLPCSLISLHYQLHLNTNSFPVISTQTHLGPSSLFYCTASGHLGFFHPPALVFNIKACKPLSGWIREPYTKSSVPVDILFMSSSQTLLNQNLLYSKLPECNHGRTGSIQNAAQLTEICHQVLSW